MKKRNKTKYIKKVIKECIQINEGFASNEIRNLYNKYFTSSRYSVYDTKVISMLSKKYNIPWDKLTDKYYTIERGNLSTYKPGKNDLTFWFITEKKVKIVNKKWNKYRKEYYNVEATLRPGLGTITLGTKHLSTDGKVLYLPKKKSTNLIGLASEYNGKKFVKTFKGLRNNASIALTIHLDRISNLQQEVVDKRNQRKSDKEGAIGLMSPQEIKNIANKNLDRYKKILAKRRSSSEEIDKKVNDYIKKLYMKIDKWLKNPNDANTSLEASGSRWDRTISRVLEDIMNYYNKYVECKNIAANIKNKIEKLKNMDDKELDLKLANSELEYNKDKMLQYTNNLTDIINKYKI